MGSQKGFKRLFPRLLAMLDRRITIGGLTIQESQSRGQITFRLIEPVINHFR